MLSGNVLEIDLTGFAHNVKYITSKYSGYDYYMGVVKANAYGCGYYKTIEVMDKNGINFFVVGNLGEALEVREYTNKGILILTPVFVQEVSECIKNNISITVDSLEYLKSISNPSGLKIHIKLNTGMNRFGTSDIDEIKEIIKYSLENDIFVEGIYTHLYYASNRDIVNKQIDMVCKVMESIDYSLIPIRHIMNSEGVLNYQKFKYTTGIRFGDILYGVIKDENYKSTLSLKSRVSKIRMIHDGDTVGYNATYECKKDEYLAILPIGYEHGLLRVNKGRDVYINNKPYKIVGNICMCNTFVLVDESVKEGDVVDIIPNSSSIVDIASYTDTTPGEVSCIIDKKIKKIYIE